MQAPWSPKHSATSSCNATALFSQNATSLLDAANIAQIVAHSNVSSQQKRAYAALVHSLLSDHRVNAVVIGGSVTAGTGCNDDEHGLHGAQCSFSARFGHWMRCHYAHKQLHIAHRARGGLTTAAALPLLPPMLRLFEGTATEQEVLTDWLLVDFSSNDAAFEYYYGASPSSRRLLEMDLASTPVAAATEVMLRYLTAEHPNIPILVIESDCRSTNSSLAHEMVARRYGVPFLAYAHALTNKTGCTKSAWHLGSHSRVHPLWDTHATLGEMLAKWWQAFSASLPTSESEPGNLAPTAKLDEAQLGPYITSASTRAPFVVCGSAMTVYDAHEAYAAARGHHNSTISRRTARSPLSAVVSQGWELYEDRPSKPGWITQGPPGASIAFNLTFGAAPRLLLLYEAGYEGWGKIHLHLGERTSRRGAQFVVVSGQRTGGENVTQAELLAIECGADSEGGRNNHNIRPYSNATLKLVFVSKPPLRFKVLHVSSC